MIEPKWVPTETVLFLNARNIARFGGHDWALRDKGLLVSALARPLQKWQYEKPQPDLCDLAAAYAFGICKNHAFVDGNKRTAHAVAVAFLRENGMVHDAETQEVVGFMLAVAESSITETELAEWFRRTSRAIRSEP